MTEPRIRVGRWVRYYREQAGLSQEALARLADVSFTTVNRTENGVSDATVDTLHAMAKALGVPFVALFQDQMPRSRSTRRTGNGYSPQTGTDQREYDAVAAADDWNRRYSIIIDEIKAAMNSAKRRNQYALEHGPQPLPNAMVG